MNSSWLVPVIVLALLPFVMKAVGRKNATHPVVVCGVTELRLPKIFIALGWISVLMGVFFTWGAAMIIIRAEWFIGIFLLLMAAIFGWMAFEMVMDGRNHRVAFDDQTITVTDGRKRTQRCAWEHVVAGRVHPFSKMIHIRTKNGQTLKLNPYLIGSDALFEKMMARTELPVEKLVAAARQGVR